MSKGNLSVDVRCVRAEPAVFVSENGKITAKLMFTPLRIISAVNPYTGERLREGSDYTVNGKTVELCNTNVLYLCDEWLRGINVPPHILSLGDEYGIKDVLLMDAKQLAKFQFRFTYETSDENDMPKLAFGGDNLKNTRKKLEEGKPVRILLYGDSISNAANSSGEMGIAPFEPAWYDSAAKEVSEFYGTQIEVINRSKSGYGSTWGAKNAAGLIGGEQFDLLIIAFGMNDGSEKLGVERFAENIRAILGSRKDTGGDFILVSTILPSPHSVLSGMQGEYRTKLYYIAQSRGAVMDMTALSEYLIPKKRYCDVSGNNFNHPNDFVYLFYKNALAELLGTKQEKILI